MQIRVLLNCPPIVSLKSDCSYAKLRDLHSVPAWAPTATATAIATTTATATATARAMLVSGLLAWWQSQLTATTLLNNATVPISLSTNATLHNSLLPADTHPTTTEARLPNRTNVNLTTMTRTTKPSIPDSRLPHVTNDSQTNISDASPPSDLDIARPIMPWTTPETATTSALVTDTGE